MFSSLFGLSEPAPERRLRLQSAATRRASLPCTIDVSRPRTRDTTGKTNENAVLNFLRRQPYAKALLCVGILAVKDGSWLASSADAIMILDMTKLLELFFVEQVIPRTVEVKTSVSSTTVLSRTSIATRDLVFMKYTNPDVTKYILEENFGELVHQIITTNVNAAFYVASRESMFSIMVMFDEWII